MYLLANRRSTDANWWQRNFRFYSILGFTSTLMCTWEAMLACVFCLMFLLVILTFFQLECFRSYRRWYWWYHLDISRHRYYDDLCHCLHG
jgi:hypothetical protein